MPQHEPERRCIISGTHGERDVLIRLALGPDGCVLPDLQARAPGRGAWISADRTLIETAQAKGRMRGALARAFKQDGVTAPDDLSDRIETGLARLVFDRLGLEMRAGHLIYGSARIEDALRAGRVAVLLHANDAAPDGRAKLDRLAGKARIIELPVSRAEISLALGRENVVHAALCDRGAAERVLSAVERWCAFRGIENARMDAGELSAPDGCRK